MIKVHDMLLSIYWCPLFIQKVLIYRYGRVIRRQYYIKLHCDMIQVNLKQPYHDDSKY